MARYNYLDLDKVTLVDWVDKALLQSLKTKTITLAFRVCGIWPLNPTIMVGNFDPNEVFIVAKDGEENAYQLDATNSNNSGDEVEVAINLLNIANTF
jgi:hypothetical protein